MGNIFVWNCFLKKDQKHEQDEHLTTIKQTLCTVGAHCAS